MATVFHDRGQFREAEKMQREVLAVRLRTLGPNHPDTALAMYNIADELHSQKRNSEAAAMFRQTADIQRRVLGLTHAYTLDTLHDLACVLAADGKSVDALAALREAVDNGLSAGTDGAPLEAEPDLKSLHGDPRFEAIVAESHKRAAANPKKLN